MIIVSVMYPKTGQSRFDFDYYVRVHMPLVQQRFEAHGLEGYRMMRGVAGMDGSSPAYEVITHLTFPSMDHLNQALGAAGPEIIGDIPNFTNVQPAIQVNEPL